MNAFEGGATKLNYQTVADVCAHTHSSSYLEYNDNFVHNFNWFS
jgi:hypothetical protein